MYFNYKPIITYGLRYSSNEQHKKHLIKNQLNLEFIRCGGSGYVYHHIMMECGIIINTFVPVDFSGRATNQKVDYKAHLHTSYRWWKGEGKGRAVLNILVMFGNTKPLATKEVFYCDLKRLQKC